MKSINEIILEEKSGSLKKLYMLTIMIPYEMYKEYDAYKEFFDKLDTEELRKFEALDELLTDIDDNSKRCKFSIIKDYFDIINELVDYMIEHGNLSKDDLKIWKEIQENIK